MLVIILERIIMMFVVCYYCFIAVDLGTLPQVSIGQSDDSAILVIDGTWAQAKSMFKQNPYLHQVKQV